MRAPEGDLGSHGTGRYVIRGESMTKTAFIAIVGRPNVGKSTLLNQILGEKVAIVSKRPQTTRNRITGIFTQGEDQFVFLDTPGLHNPRTKLGDFMVKTTDSAIGEADAAILVVEPREAVGEIEQTVLPKASVVLKRLITSGSPAGMVLASMPVKSSSIRITVGSS